MSGNGKRYASGYGAVSFRLIPGYRSKAGLEQERGVELIVMFVLWTLAAFAGVVLGELVMARLCVKKKVRS